MDLGFGPKLSRVAAGVCLILFFGLLRHLFGLWIWLGIFGPALVALLLLVTFPRSPAAGRAGSFAVRVPDPLPLLEWLQERFENLAKRLRR